MDLKKLQEQLNKGEVDDSFKNHLKAVLDKSENIGVNHASKSIDERIQKSGEVKPEMDKEKREEINSLYDEKIKEMESIDLMNKKKTMIMNYEATLQGIRDDYEATIKEMESELEDMKNAFNEEYGD